MNVRTLSQEQRQAWLDQNCEEVLEPQLEICDPHHHLWDHPGSRYRAEELADDITDGHRVLSTVYIDCTSGYRTEGPPEMFPVGEVEYARSEGERIARRHPGICLGIVGHADMRLGAAVRDVLQAQTEAGGGRFCGIRHANAWDASDAVRASHSAPPPGLLGHDDFRAGIAVLADMGLTFDGWLYHPQIHEFTSLARAFPQLTMVLDHIGGPLGIGAWAGQREHIFQSWRHDIADLAQCPNVYVKLGGCAMPVNGYSWHRRPQPPTSEEYAAAYREWMLHCIDCFGPQRCMFESNFPVDRISISYRTLYNGFKRIVADFGEEDKRALFHDSAATAYSLRYP